MSQGSRGWSIAAVKAMIVIGAVVAADQGSKQLALARVDPGHPVELLLGVELANVRNRGVAFGLLSGAGDAVILAATLVAFGALGLYFALNATKPYLWLVTGLLAGGALSNLIDRLGDGAVTDFIDFPAWPAFNLADVAIVVGAAGLALTVLQADDPDRRAD